MVTDDGLKVVIQCEGEGSKIPSAIAAEVTDFQFLFFWIKGPWTILSLAWRWGIQLSVRNRTLSLCGHSILLLPWEYEKIKASDSILIVGGGPTGVELAAEIATDFPAKKVTLVHRGSRLLEFIGESASKKALNWLTSKKVEVILGQSVDVNSPSDGVYRTSGGETVAADCYFLCTGTPFGSAWLKETILKDSLDSRGRVMVDSNLRVKGCNNIFAIGDITDVPELKQGYLAQEHAKVVAKNITSLIKGVEDDHKLAVYKPATKALAIVSLGRKDAVAQFPCLSIAGRIPGMIKSGDLFVGKTRKGLGLQPGA